VTRQIRSELLKLRTTRTTLGLVLGLLGLVAFIVVIQLVTSHFEDAGIPRLDDPATQRAIFATGSAASLFAALVGVLAVTGEFRHGTIRPTLLFTPVRELVVAAKGVACALAGLLLGLLAVALAFGITLAWLEIDDVERWIDGGELANMAAGIAVGALLWAAIGVGVGAVVRNQVAAVVGTILWAMIPDPLLLALVPDVGRFMPVAASDALAGGVGEDLLSPLAGLLVLAGWAIALTAAGVVVTARRDVP
jgi:ABC-type transport system involved in multi-copper enzyme maturation permease subunit